MGPEDLAEIVSKLSPEESSDLIVGIEHSDDAGVCPISPEMALVQTLDFITPNVDDPFRFGRIAAANSLSDVYAMGGTPLTALNICCFPPKLEKSVLAEILRGGQSAILEAGALLAGGHTIKDSELKYGLSVTGTVSPLRVLPNSGAKAGDRLILSKALGTAALFSGYGAGELSEEDMGPAVQGMMTLNKVAAETLQPFVEEVTLRSEADPSCGVHALSDVTGFGLAGHAHEVALASGLAVELIGQDLPEYPGAREMIRKERLCGGSRTNRKALGDLLVSKGAREEDLWLACDAQTSGGLLISVAESDADSLLSELLEAGVSDACFVGRALKGPAGQVVVLG